MADPETDFSDALKCARFSVRLKGNSKDRIIKELVSLVAKNGGVRDKKAVLEAVLEREQKMSTGMQHGVAIPHGKTDAVKGLQAVVALKKEGIDFSSIDGKPSRIFVLTVSPAGEGGIHIQFLAEISKLLNDEGTRSRLLAARREEEMREVLVGKGQGRE